LVARRLVGLVERMSGAENPVDRQKLVATLENMLLRLWPMLPKPA
jgi:hypothetical protein